MDTRKKEQGSHKNQSSFIVEAATPIQTVLGRLERVRQTGPGRWMASCPVETHMRGDRNRSLSIRETSSGDVLLKCFTGHAADEIVAALGLELASLFHTTAGRGHSGRGNAPRIAWADVFQALEHDLRVMSLAFTDLAAGKRFSPVDAMAIAKLAMEMANVIMEVKHGGA